MTACSHMVRLLYAMMNPEVSAYKKTNDFAAAYWLFSYIGSPQSALSSVYYKIKREKEELFNSSSIFRAFYIQFYMVRLGVTRELTLCIDLEQQY